MIRLKPFPLLILLIFVSCAGGEKREIVQPQTEKRVGIKGYEVPRDSILEPKVVQAGKAAIVRARSPKIVKQKSSSRIGGEPLKFKATTPRKFTPGTNGLSKPREITATTVSYPADAPEVVLLKKSDSKDINSHGFTSFGTIQGLKTNQIRCLLQDRKGNLWFSSDEGVTRYDGKYLSHFEISNSTRNSNIVLCMLEDSSGFLWFGTFGGGVICFDGIKLTQYTEDEGLSNNIVNCIIQDKSGDFWMATSGGGVSKFDGKVFTHYTTSEGLASNQVRSILQDRDGKIWFGTFGSGVSLFDGTNFFNYSVGEGFPANHIASIIQDNIGNIWFGSYQQGLVKYDGLNFTQFTEAQGLSSNKVLCISQDEYGKLWLGTSGGGISIFDGEIFSNYTEEDGLSNNYVRCLLIGREGDFWFGTRDGGLVRYTGNIFAHFTVEDGLAGNKVIGMLQDSKGILWFTSYGGGIASFDGKEFAAYSLKETYLNDFVYAILEDKKGNIWFGSDGGGITRFDGKFFSQYTQQKGLCHNSVRCMTIDRHQNIWIGSYGGGVSKFNGKIFTNYSVKEGLSSDKILAIMEDRRGIIWFGTDGGGACCYDGKKFTRFSVKEGMNSNVITSIIQDKIGNIWFGTSGGGVSRFDGQYITSLTTKEGLTNNFITSLKQDRGGDLWIGTRLGPNVIRESRLQSGLTKTNYPIFETYTYDDGFLGISCNLNSILQDKNGVIWIGSTNRLTAIRPKEEAADTAAPDVEITNIKLHSENIPWLKIASKRDTSFVLENGVKVGNFKFGVISKWYFLPENLQLAYNNNFVSFSFVGITLKQVSKIRYQYQLEGANKFWNSPTEDTEISYGNLKPGNYLFKVKAMNSEGIWSKECHYAFSVKSPWWKTWWFYSLIILGIFSLIIFYTKQREVEHVLQRKLLNEIIEEKTHELKEKNIELEKKNDELLISDSEKDKFFSIIAHDVRGPLGTFHLLTELISENIEVYELKDIRLMTSNMQKSAASLFKLLENLLVWARMQRGLIQYNPEQLNLIETLNDLIEPLLLTTKNKSIAIMVDIAVNLQIFADKNMVETVLRNLISNAVKFTPKGGKVSVKAEKKDDCIIISIMDTGIGMDENMLRDLFKIDIHNKRKGTEGESSTGLGLLLCSDFAKRMNGHIWAESQVNKGSTFYFSLPCVS
jgi:ligand-binding sensor domain-containing protein/signal transduction histidine kinase